MAHGKKTIISNIIKKISRKKTFHVKLIGPFIVMILKHCESLDFGDGETVWRKCLRALIVQCSHIEYEKVVSTFLI